MFGDLEIEIVLQSRPVLGEPLEQDLFPPFGVAIQVKTSLSRNWFRDDMELVKPEIGTEPLAELLVRDFSGPVGWAESLGDPSLLGVVER
jgi:hypothetical protein